MIDLLSGRQYQGSTFFFSIDMCCLIISDCTSSHSREGIHFMGFAPVLPILKIVSILEEKKSVTIIVPICQILDSLQKNKLVIFFPPERKQHLPGWAHKLGHIYDAQSRLLFLSETLSTSPMVRQINNPDYVAICNHLRQYHMDLHWPTALDCKLRFTNMLLITKKN